MRGWQVSKVQYDKIWSYIEAGKQQGATLVLGGEKRAGKGYYVDPTSACVRRGCASLARC